MMETIWLQRPGSDVPWGFRLKGGRDFQEPLTVQRVSPGSIASTGLAVGDVILQVADTDTSTLTFSQAQELIKTCGNLLQFSIKKAASKVPHSPQTQVESRTGVMASEGVHDLFRDMCRHSELISRSSPDRQLGEPQSIPIKTHNPSHSFTSSSGPSQPTNTNARVIPIRVEQDYYPKSQENNGYRRRMSSDDLLNSKHTNGHHDVGIAHHNPHIIPPQVYHQNSVPSSSSDEPYRRRRVERSRSVDTTNLPPSYANLDTDAYKLDNLIEAKETPTPTPSYHYYTTPVNTDSVHQHGRPSFIMRKQNLTEEEQKINYPMRQLLSTGSQEHMTDYPTKKQSVESKPEVPLKRMISEPSYPYKPSPDVKCSPPNYPYKPPLSEPEPMYPYKPPAPNSTYEAVSPYPNISSSTSPSWEGGQRRSSPSYQPPSMTGTSGAGYNTIQPYAASISSSISELSDLSSAPSLPESKPPPLPVGGWSTPEYESEPTEEDICHPQGVNTSWSDTHNLASPTRRQEDANKPPSYPPPPVPPPPPPLPPPATRPQLIPPPPPPGPPPPLPGSMSPHSPSSPVPPPLPSSRPPPSLNPSLQLPPKMENPGTPTSPQPVPFATRLDQQLASMHTGGDKNNYMNRMNSIGSPPATYGVNSSTPPGAPDFTYGSSSPATNSYSGYHPMSPTSPGGPPQTSGPPLPPPKPSFNRQEQQQPVMPDAVLNMAAKGAPDKKPWSYAPDVNILKEQRDKVRRRAPGGALPRYQNMLNLPNFDDTPIASPPTRATPSTPQSPPSQDSPTGGDTGGVVAHSQYNSPLQMYSDDNVVNAFHGQTGGDVVGVGRQGGKKDQKDITQSAVYKMIHGLDEAPKPKPLAPPAPAPRPEGHRTALRQPSYDDELKFSGVPRRETSDIPSKSFHKLQMMTGGSHPSPEPSEPRGGSEIDTTSIRAYITGEEPDIGNYDEQSIRYKGRNIPSKSFRMLQSMTGGPDIPPPVPQPTRKPLRQARPRPPPVHPPPEPEEPQTNPDDIVDISYVGANIPSRSFKILQHAIGEPTTPSDAEPKSVAVHSNIPSVTPGGPEDTNTARRRRRRRPLSRSQSRDNEITPTEDETNTAPGAAQFDEAAYLAGRVNIISDPTQKPKTASATSQHKEKPEWQKKQEEEEEKKLRRQFDEGAYLMGQVSLFGDEPLKRDWQPKDKSEEKPDWVVKAEQLTPGAQFDENSILAGKDKGVREETPEWANKIKVEEFDESKFRPTKVISGETPEWAQRKVQINEDKILAARQQENKEDTPDWANRKIDFDENKILAGKENKDEEKPSWLSLAEDKQKKNVDLVAKDEPVVEVPQSPEDARPEVVPFDEEAFLAGRLPILGGEAKPLPPKYNEPEIMPTWKKEDESIPENERQFDEHSYLMGRIPLVKGGEAEIIPEPKPTRRRRRPKQPSHQAPPSKPFDEDAYLSGDVNLLGGAVEQTSKPPRERRRRPARERAAWEKEDNEPMTDDEFSEEAFLKGRIPILRASVDRELPPRPTAPDGTKKERPKARRYRARAPWERDDADADDVGQASDAEFDEDAFLLGRVSVRPQSVDRDVLSNGEAFKKIPSKTFLRLSRSVSRDASREASPDAKVGLRRARSMSKERGEDLQDDRNPFNNLMYVGKKIPSKTFLKLQNNIKRKEIDPLQRLRSAGREEETLDVDEAMDKLKIETTNPEKYLDALKKTVEDNNMKVEFEEDVTDF